MLVPHGAERGLISKDDLAPFIDTPALVRPRKFQPLPALVVSQEGLLGYATILQARFLKTPSNCVG